MKKYLFASISLLLFTQISMAKDKFDIKRFREQAKNNEVAYTDSKGNQVREMETPAAFIQKQFDGSGSYIYQREYNKEGKLAKEGYLAKVAKQEIPVGTWTSYDLKGKVTETKNHEEGYQVTFTNVLDICQKRNIDLTDRLSSLTKSKPGERPMWVIGWNSMPARSEKKSANDRSPDTRMEIIVVDGVTGDIKESSPYVPFKN